MKKILITGGAGTIGSALARCLKKLDTRVLLSGLGRNLGGSSQLYDSWYTCDITDAKSLYLVGKSLGNYDLVIHAAAAPT